MTRSKLPLSRLHLPGLALGWLLLCETSCVVSPQSDAPFEVESTVRVKPRLVIDGLLGLAARTEGRLFVDRVGFHSPTVHIRDNGRNLVELLSTDPVQSDPLFFWYDIAEDAADGAAWGGERYWRFDGPQLYPDSQVVFQFAPLRTAGSALEQMEERVGKDLGELSGYTAFIHGYVAVDEEADAHFTASSKPDSEPPGRPSAGADSGAGTQHSGDPEGDPASGDPEGDPASGDPEGDPASGDPEGDPASGDPEGDPASGDPEGDPASGDPEGDPALGDPEGDPALGDPEGDPADGLTTSSGAAGADWNDAPHQSVFPSREDAPIARRKLVPFLVVFSADFALPIPFGQLGLHLGAADQALPIDLHIDVNELFSSRRLQSLDHQVRQGGTQALLEVEAKDMPSLFELTRSESEDDSPRRRIEVTRDPRGDPQ